jgi:hypothetical protein
VRYSERAKYAGNKERQNNTQEIFGQRIFGLCAEL